MVQKGIQYFFTILIFLSLFSCKARQKTLKIDEAIESKEFNLDFPYDILGYWDGNLEIYSADSLLQTIPMSILIDETGDPDIYSWNLIYNPGENEDKRPYLLMMHNPKKNHYKIDEDNGIILDCFLLDNKLITSFEVGTSQLTTINTFLQDDMVFEVIAGPTEKISTTGDLKVGEMQIPPVYSYQVKTYQRAILKRIRG